MIYLLLLSSSVCPEDWQDFSDANILKAERERQSSVELRTLIDGILQQTSNDMRKQCSEVNVCFNKRISETKDTKSKLEDHLNKVWPHRVLCMWFTCNLQMLNIVWIMSTSSREFHY